MEPTEIILVGGGQQGCVTADAAISSGKNIVAIFDPRSCEPLPGLISIGPYNEKSYSTASAVVSIGDNRARKKLADEVSHNFTIIKHPSAIVSGNSEIAPGTTILHGAVVQARATVGSHVILNTRSSVDHHCVIGDYVHIGPGAVLCGRVVVGEGSFVGAGAVVLPGIIIGRWAVIGAGSVVTRNVADGEVVAGNPARVLKVTALPG